MFAMTRVIAAIFFCFFAVAAFAQEMPDALVKQVTEDVLDVIRKDKEIQNGNTRKVIDLVELKVLPHFNFQHMTALAVGKEWKKASVQQRQLLAQEFKNLLVRTYANALTGYKNQRISYKPLKMNPGDEQVLVRTDVLQPGSKAVELDYSLEKLESGWKVFDVSVSGISLVTNYREQFANEVRNGGIDGLIETIAAKNKSLDVSMAKADKK